MNNDIANMPISHINNHKMITQRFESLVNKLELMTGLEASDNTKLLHHIMEFKKDWSLLKVYKAFEFQFSVKCEKRVESFGKEITVAYFADVLKAYQAYLHSVQQSRPRTFATEPEISPQEKDKRNKLALIRVFEMHKQEPAKRKLIAYSKFYELLEHFNLLPEGSYQDYREKAKEQLLREREVAKHHHEFERVTMIDHLLRDNTMDGVMKRLACVDYFDSTNSINL